MGKVNQLLEKVVMTDIADKGMSVGRDANGQVVFIQGGVPGDIADVLVKQKKKGTRFGVIEKLLTASEYRTDPFCNYFGVCGGCKWQHMTYEGQIHYKEQVVHNAMSRIAKVDIDAFEPILGAPETRFYRNKLEYSFSNRRWLTDAEMATLSDEEKGRGLGFHRPGFFDKIVDIHQCFLQDSFSDRIRNFVRDYAAANNLSFYDIKNHHGLFRTMIVRNTLLGEWMVVFTFGENKEDDISKFLISFREAFQQIQSIQYVVNTKKNDTIFDQEVISWSGPGYITEQLGNIRYRIGPKSFFQTNTRQAQNLYNVALDYAGLDGSQTVYDLYTGLGSIALYVSQHCKNVLGIEEIDAAIDDAKLNSELNGVTNASFLTGDVRLLLQPELVNTYGRPDVIITDPPRAGMHPDVVDTLLTFHAPKIVYVSCNPATQARDLHLLSEKYNVARMKPVDMFPHTDHIENVALLVSK